MVTMRPLPCAIIRGRAVPAPAAGDHDRLLREAGHANRTLTDPSRVKVARTVSPARAVRIFDTDPVMTTSPARSPSPREPRWFAIHASEFSGLPITSYAVLVATTVPLCS